MLRIAVLFLVLANAGYYAWSQGLLRNLGWTPEVQTEPRRLEQQIAPTTLDVVPVKPGSAASTPATPAAAASAAAASAAAPTPALTVAVTAAVAPASAPASATPVAALPGAAAAPVAGTCVQVGTFDERQAQALRTALADWPASSWQMDASSISGRWMVYMGRFPDDEVLAKKRAELRHLKIDYDRPGPAHEPGLSLGRFSTEEAAQRALTQLSNQGVRTARVVVERQESTVYTLKLPSADAAQRSKLEGMRTALAGKTPKTCP